jgi:hypothetical protein
MELLVANNEKGTCISLLQKQWEFDSLIHKERRIYRDIQVQYEVELIHLHLSE